MKKVLLLATILLLSQAFQSFAQEPVFVEDADQMVEQMLAGGSGEKKFGRTRSFVVAEEVQPKSRAIKARRKNAQGQQETVVVKVPVDGLDPAARLKVEFDVNSANLRPSAYKLLSELAKALQNEKVVEHNVCVKGHTDGDGSEDYNLQLSYDRAESVRAYLLGAFSLSPERFQVFGYGEAMPLAANTSSFNKQLNRRVEVALNCTEFN